MGRRGWLLWVLALVTVPVPYAGIGTGAAPVSYLAVVAGVAASIGVLEGGEIGWIFAGVLAAHVLVWGAVLFVAAGRLRTTVERRVPAGQEPWVAIVLAIALGAVPFLGVYSSGFANVEGRVPLASLWRLAEFDAPKPAAVPAPLAPEGTASREPCADRTPLRRPLFGDLHVHTRYSLDASTQGTRNGPRAAYRFARGASIGLQPYDHGRPLRRIRLERPLDFAAVTDHAELFGEVQICKHAELPGYGSFTCQLFRRWPRLAFYFMNARATSTAVPARHPFCGPRDVYCVEAALSPWRAMQDAAEEAYDRTAACSFTTFIGYEWTGAPGSRNLHRNVVFSDRVVPDRPISYYEAPSPPVLWRQLGKHCMESLPGCDAIAIPHNSNLSGNTMFEPPPGQAMTAAHAAAWAAAEPLVEIMQHKGDSECGPGAADEECGFEKLPYDRFGGKFNPWMAEAPAPGNYVRAALGEGLAYEARIGVNPFTFGFIAGTDTHLGTPGAVEERGYPGHGGAGNSALSRIAPGFPDDVEFNPGGLAVVWAEENSREAIFAAMKRRETYGTSGPRITLRVFAGWNLPDPMCGAEGFAERGYASGVPMGGMLVGPPPEGTKGPTFAVWAVRDPGTEHAPGTPLERVQIVKGWLENGEPRERVLDVAGRREPDAVDPRSCEVPADGFDSLCESWSDPDFDPAVPAYYYVRVLERPSCRWTTRVCNEHGVDCDDPSTVPASLAACCDGSVPATTRERAWASPIWYLPKAPAPTTPPSTEEGGPGS